jgi:hypothetical protein
MALFFFIATAGLFPCAISFDSSELKAVKNRVTQVTVYLQLKHRNCVLPPSQTIFEAQGLIIQKKGNWENVKDNLHKITLSVIPLQNTGEIRVIRECGRHNTVTATLKVSGR